MHLALRVGLWLVALAWLVRTAAAHFGLPKVPDLLLAEQPVLADGPTLTVIVPARDEERDVRACLESLLRQDYRRLEIIAVDDRSSDATGDIMLELAARYPERMRALTIEELPGGWLGKTHAMAVAARAASSDFLLFTDADILFAPNALRLALGNVMATGADHFVLLPTTIIRRWDEGALLSFLQVFGLWAVRPWKVADPKVRDAIGVGAFNLIRRSAYESIGGFAAFPMEIVEDLGLARRVKQAGFRPGVAYGKGLVSVHWAAGVRGLVNVMTKNIFSIFNFHVPLLLFSCVWLMGFAIAPFAAVFVPWLAQPAAVTIVCVAYLYWLSSRQSGLPAWNAMFAPFAASVFLYALLRSMAITLRQGGVVWRGTFYPLAELRRHTAPLLLRRASNQKS